MTPAPRSADYAHRRTRVVAALAGHGLGALWVTGRSNVRYLTGFSGSSASLLVAGDGHVLATDGRYATQAEAEVGGLDDDVQLEVTRDGDWVVPRMQRLLASGCGIGVEAEHLSLARYGSVVGQLPNGALRPLTGLVEDLRCCKDEAELDALRRAARITATAFDAMYGWLAPGLTEQQVAHRLVGEMLDRGADGPAFDFIVAAGAGGAEPHHAPTGHRLRRGELVTVDAGARLDGYHADMTRTVALGTPPPVLRDVYQTVAAAQHRGVLRCRADVDGGDVDRACREVVQAAGHGPRFSHPTGHGVGLDIHEPPILHRRQAATLRPGMAITVEPGIYLPGTGGVRIEDVVAVTAGDPHVLTGRPGGPPDAGPAGSATGSLPDSDALPQPPTIHDLLVL